MSYFASTSDYFVIKLVMLSKPLQIFLSKLGTTCHYCKEILFYYRSHGSNLITKLTCQIVVQFIYNYCSYMYEIEQVKLISTKETNIPLVSCNDMDQSSMTRSTHGTAKKVFKTTVIVTYTMQQKEVT